MIDLLKETGKHFNTTGTFTFGAITDEAFIENPPNNKFENVIILSEKTSLTQTSQFGNKSSDYQSRSVQIYLYGTSGDLKNVRDKAFAIYNELLSKSTIGDNIFAIQPNNPNIVSEKEEARFVYLVEFSCKVR